MAAVKVGKHDSGTTCWRGHPCKDEESHIEGVLILPETVDLAVVVNDGSVDRTAGRPWPKPCEVVVIDGNGDGVGAAIDRGHRHLLSKDGPFISVVMAGGQMNPDDMEAPFNPSSTAQRITEEPLPSPEGLTACRNGQRATVALVVHDPAAGQPFGDRSGYTAPHRGAVRMELERSWSGYGYPNFCRSTSQDTVSGWQKCPLNPSIETKPAAFN